MNQTKSFPAQIWERLNPFQSNARLGTMREEPIFPHSDETNQCSDMVTASEKRWTIVAEGQQPTPFMQNGASEAKTALEENSVNSLTRQKNSIQKQRAVRLKPATLTSDRFQVLQKWEGTVLELDGDVMYARLKDLTQDNPSEEVEIALEEVFTDDQPLVHPGASFYWSVGYLHKLHGQRLRASELRFRRIPGWSEDELDAAKYQAETDGTFYNLDCGESCA